jgi:hypothetical protein
MCSFGSLSFVVYLSIPFFLGVRCQGRLEIIAVARARQRIPSFKHRCDVYERQVQCTRTTGANYENSRNRNEADGDKRRAFIHHTVAGY